MRFFVIGLVGVTVHIQTALAQSCSATLEPSYPAPSLAAGYEARLVAQGLNDPRSIVFDPEGNLLVLEQRKGVTRLVLDDSGGNCLSVRETQSVVENGDLNHGLDLSEDGRTLFASSADEVFAWSYDPSTGTTTSDPEALIGGMDNEGHTTRTILLSRKVPDTLLVSRGSASNVDQRAADVESGHCQLKAFNIASTSTLDFTAEGEILGWGLRNSVGVAEHPVTGGIWSVENSVDQFRRAGEDIHQDNPGEELNFHGYLNGTEYSEQGRSFGYPSCFAAWDVSSIPNNEGVEVGDQVAIGEEDSETNDEFCRENTVSPRITFQAHQAPLDIKFNANGSEAWITFHGSWNRDEPTGYKLSMLRFADGSPVEPQSSTDAAIDIMTNPDTSECPDNCFRPVGLAWDAQGRLFMSSDSTGEIYVIARAGGGSVSESEESGTVADAAPSASATSDARLVVDRPWMSIWLALLAAACSLALLS